MFILMQLSEMHGAGMVKFCFKNYIFKLKFFRGGNFKLSEKFQF